MSTLPSRRPLLPDSPPRIPPPAYRHAAPSGPWPWMNLDSVPETEPTQPTPICSHGEDCNRCWTLYPQSLYPNWTPAQVKRCGMKVKVDGSHTCVIHHVDVHKDGHYFNVGSYPAPQAQSDELWSQMVTTNHKDLRVRCLCLQNMTVPVMQMLGTKYNIEPFFFSSSLNWIPSRYQENAHPAQGDHITITLTFIRPMKAPEITTPYRYVHTPTPSEKSHIIDTQLPLIIASDGQSDGLILALDLLAVHMIRTPGNSVIITYHPSHDRRDPPQPHTSATHLHSRIALAGESVYWQNIFKQTEDPTLILLTILWYALYAWDEALELLWDHICRLESSVIESSDINFTRQLHEIRAHILHYSSLLDDFRKSVDFVLKMPNPAMESPIYDDRTRQISRDFLQKECENLLMEIDRLTMSRNMQDMRLKNVMDLVFSSVNIEDSRHMQSLTEATVRDSQAMKQIAYLTMVFLPASFCSGVFGMNVMEINPGTSGKLWQYFVATTSLTAATIWVIIAFQGNWRVEGTGRKMSLWLSLLWPMIAMKRLYTEMKGRAARVQDLKMRRRRRDAIMNGIPMESANTA